MGGILMVGLKQAWKNYWRGYVDFTGNATRAEFWWLTLINSVLAFVFGWIPVVVIAIITYRENGNGFSQMIGWLLPVGAFFLYKIATLLPDLALNARRWQDAGFRLWHWLVVGAVGIIVYLTESFTEAQGGTINTVALIALVLLGLLSFVVSLLPSRRQN